MRSVRSIWPPPSHLPLSPCSTIHSLCTRKKQSDCLPVYRVYYGHQCTAVAVVSLLIVMIIGNNHLLDYNQVWYPALGKLLWRFNKLEMMSTRAQQLITVTEPDHSLPYRYQMLWWDGMFMKKVFVFYCIFVCFCVRKHTSKSWYTLHSVPECGFEGLKE